jgi:hypothetical protein
MCLGPAPLLQSCVCTRLKAALRLRCFTASAVRGAFLRAAPRAVPGAQANGDLSTSAAD